MSSEYIVRYCSPTLAGIKTGSLFSCRCDSAAALRSFVEEQNRILIPRGVRMVLIRHRDGLALIYVYRAGQLQKLLNMPEIQQFLRQYGYRDFEAEACIRVLRRRLCREDFPHDIGIFLGYPLSDVRAFIANKGENCPCVGDWKAYTNVRQARRTFQSYRKCTQIYCRMYSQNADIARLTVAG